MIDDILSALEKKHSIFTSMGVNNGIGGLSLFHYYYSKHKKTEESEENIFKYLGMALEGLNEGYAGTSIERDILELSRLLAFFQKKGVLDSEDVQVYYESFDPILIELALEKLNAKEISPFLGAIAYGYYFLITRTNDSYLDELIDTIEELAHNDDVTGGIYWISEIERDGERLVELGGNHGVAGIIHFLLELYANNIQQSRIKPLIENSLEFLKHKEMKGQIGLFPFSSESKLPNKTLNLAYGNLSIGNVFYKAGELLENTAYLNTGERIILHSADHRDDDEVSVKDANLLYGSSGLSSFFQHYQRKLNSTKLDEAIQYWNQRSEIFKRNNNEWAGFETHFNRFDINAPLSFCHGIVGIGICAIQNETENKDFDYLHFFNI